MKEEAPEQALTQNQGSVKEHCKNWKNSSRVGAGIAPQLEAARAEFFATLTLARTLALPRVGEPALCEFTALTL